MLLLMEQMKRVNQSGQEMQDKIAQEKRKLQEYFARSEQEIKTKLSVVGKEGKSLEKILATLSDDVRKINSPEEIQSKI